MLKKQLGKRIKERRMELGISQEQLGEAVNMSTKSISFIETGRNAPSIEKFVLIANELKVSADVLLSDVLEYGYKVKASKFGEIIEKLSDEKREQVFDVIAAILKSNKK